jgi:LEA14-like dessication related protein
MISRGSLAVVNKALVGAAAGGAAIVAVAVFMFSTGFGPRQLQEGEGTVQEVVLTLSEVEIKEVNEESAKIEVAFEIFNPNKNTIVLEEIRYEVSANGVMIGRSTIGERLEGMISGTGHTYYVVSNVPLGLKGTVEVNNSKLLEKVWSNLQNRDVQWRVQGAYVVTDPVRSGGQEKTFDFTM